MSFLGGDTPKAQFSPIGGSGGGLTTSFSGGGLGGGSYSVTPDANRTAAVGEVANTYSDLGNLTGGLRGQVTPGYNALLDTQLNTIDNSARKAIGDLRTNLQSRRVLGSSFGQDTLTRANAEVAKTKADVQATNFLQSLDANNKLLQQQYDAYSKAANTGLSELNLEAGVANGLISSTNKVLSDNAQFDAKMEAQSQAGAGKFFGTVLGGIGGFALGGPSGAVTGANIGSKAFGTT